MDFDCREIRK